MVVGLLCVFLSLPAMATPPAAVGTVQTSAGWNFGNEFTTDAAGNMFFIDDSTGSASAGWGTIYEVPVNAVSSLTKTTIATGFCGTQYACTGLAVDANDNVYFSDGWGSGSGVFQIPNNSGTYGSPVKLTGLQASAAGLYWEQILSLAIDSSGYLYTYDVAGPGIFKYSLSGTTATFVSKIAAQSVTVTKIVIDKAGDVFWADGTSAYEVPAGSTYPATPTVIGTGITTASSVALDAAGNLYIIDNGADVIFEVPYEGTALNFSDQFRYASDTKGATFTSGMAFFGSTAYELAHWGQLVKLSSSVDFGSSAVGTATSATTINYVFNQALTAAPTVTALVAGNSSSEFAGSGCGASSYAVGGTCALAVTFTPAKVGSRKGVIELTNGSTVLSSNAVAGVGQAAWLALDPATKSTLSSALQAPAGVAVDDAGNVFVADTSSKEILEIAVGGGTPTAVASGFSSPVAVALDGAGNLIVGDSGSEEVIEVPLSGGTYSTANEVVLGSGFAALTGVAVDNLGNVYVTDSKQSSVAQFVKDANGSYAKTTLGSGFTAPAAVAVDGAGDVFVADSGSIFEIAAGATTSTTLATGLTSANGIAVDAAGSLYVSNGTSVSMIPYSNSAFGTAQTLTATFADAQGIALDPAGNLYVSDSDSSTKAVVELNRASASLAFANTTVGNTSTSSDATVFNVGNSSQTFTGAPVYTATDTTADFTDVSASATECSATSGLAAGASCLITEEFTPLSVASLSDSLSFTGITQSPAPAIALTGKGTAVPVVPAVAVSVSPASITYGQALTLTATLTPYKSDTDTTDGETVTFKNGTTTIGSGTLASGTASFTTTATQLAAGNYSFTAVYAPATTDTAFDTNTSAAQSFTVGKAAATITLGSLSQTYTSAALAPTSTTSPTGLSVGYTYTLNSAAVTAPTNAGSYAVTATISDTNYSGTQTGTLVIGAAPLTVAASNASMVAGASVPTFSGTLTGVLGSDGITATYAIPSSCSTTVAGTCTITATLVDPNGKLGNYLVTNTTGTLTITGSAIVPTVAIGVSPSSTTYGQALTLTATLTPYKSGTLTTDGETVTFKNGTTTIGSGTLASGTASFTTTATQLAAGNYSFTAVYAPATTDTAFDTNTSAAQSFTVSKAAATITLGSLSQTYTSAALAPTSTTSPTGLSVGYTYTLNSAAVTAPTNAGSYAVTATIADTNYSGTQTGTLVIGAAPLTVAASNATMVAGASVPTFSGTLTGVLGSDGITATYAIPSSCSTAAAGTCTITATLVDPKSKLGNYLVTNTTGTLTITAGANPKLSISSISAVSLKQIGSGTTSFTLSSSAAVTGTVAISCSGLPAGLNCSPVSTTLDASTLPATVVVTVSSVPTNASNRMPSRTGWALAIMLPGLMLLPFGLHNRKRRLAVLGLFLATMLILGLTACGDSNSRTYAATGSYTATVTATLSGATTATQSFTVTLTK
jgi:hypothetical protein